MGLFGLHTVGCWIETVGGGAGNSGGGGAGLSIEEIRVGRRVSRTSQFVSCLGEIISPTFLG